MAILKLNRNLKWISRALSDENLTKKAYLNALAAGLDYAARLIVGFLVTPIMVSGLGDYFYGIWQILNRLVTYITPASGRPTQALRWTLANQQASEDYHLKRTYVGSTLVVWILFLPLTAVLGGVLAWFVPSWLATPTQFTWIIRLTIIILVANLAMTSLGTMPQSVLQGENLGYKRMGLSAFLVLIGGGFTWLALYLKLGITGVAWAALASTILTGLFFLLVMRAYTPWFGIARPAPDAAVKFLGLSWWFLGWNLVMNGMMASDVVVLGLANSVESVTNYSLTKYVPETLISIIAIIAFGIAPGLGGIIGSGKKEKAAHLRGEIMAITWLIMTVIGATILLWNRTFMKLWVGPGHYAGPFADFLIVWVVIQFVLIRNDANIIDLTLRLRNKVLIGFLALASSVGIAALLVGYFKLGIVGLCLGIIAGRFILSVGYPVLVGRYLEIPFISQLKNILRPALVSLLLFALTAGLDALAYSHKWFPVDGWLGLFFYIALTGIIVLPLTFYAGLKRDQRQNIIKRLQMLIPKAAD